MRAWTVVIAWLWVVGLARGDDDGTRVATAPDPNALAESVRAEFRLPGFVVGYRHGDDDAVFGAAGVTRAGGDRPLRVDHRMHLGSVAKPISATVAGQLVAEGTLRFETRLLDVFPELRERARPEYRDVTVWDLLSHAARLPAYTTGEEWQRLAPLEGTPREQRLQFTATVLTEPPQPEEQWEDGGVAYSNAGYIVASALIERVTDRDWEELVDAYVFRPLGLASAGFGWPGTVGEDEPWGSNRDGDTYTPHPPDDAYQLGAVMNAAGGVHMNLRDLMTFADAHHDVLTGRDGPLAAESTRRLHDFASGYGGGWRHQDGLGDWHTGSADTFFAFVVVAPERDLRVVAASNAARSEDHLEIVGRVLGPIFRAFPAE